MSKNIVPILVLFLIALVTFLALQVINTFTSEALPEPAKVIDTTKLNPNLNTKVIEDLKKAPTFN